MSLASALRTGDLAELPSRRDEGWRWTDLRGLLRVLPPPAPGVDKVAVNALLDGLGGQPQVFANGRQIAAGKPDGDVLIRRFVSASAATSHHADASLQEAPPRVLIDSFEGQADGYVADVGARIEVQAGTSLERIVLLDDAADAVFVSLTEVVLHPGARFRQTVLASGAKRQRFETRVRHLGGGADCRMDGLYVLSGSRQSDQTTQLIHEAVDGTSAQLVKGVVQDQARGVFQGRIVVAHGADRTDARMGHHALVLSDRAEVDSKPELEIYADDVACAHGNTVGALDEEALFYARSRGIPEDTARAMLMQAFLTEVIDRIEHEPARELAARWLAARLEGAP